MRKVRIPLVYNFGAYGGDDGKWILDFMRKCRRDAGVHDSEIYDYPELVAYGAELVRDYHDWNDVGCSYIEIPEDQFVLLKLKHGQ